MHTVIFENSADNDSVYDAIQWCDKEFGRLSYRLENQFPSWRWAFKFKESTQATHFALKWS